METPAPSGKGQVRAKYIRGEMEKLGLAEIRDDRSNVSDVRKLTGGGPAVVFRPTWIPFSPRARTQVEAPKATFCARPASAT